MDRILISIHTAVAALDRGETLEDLLHRPDDYLRAVYVVDEAEMRRHRREVRREERSKRKQSYDGQ